jgi:hypothetical protein
MNLLTVWLSILGNYKILLYTALVIECVVLVWAGIQRLRTGRRRLSR